MTDVDSDYFLLFIFFLVIAALIGVAFDWHRSAPARRLDNLVRRSKGRWS
jgi:hypothetical protein